MPGRADTQTPLLRGPDAGTADAVPATALGDLLAAPARVWPDRTAIDDGDVSYTFAELEQGARSVAAWLAERGVGTGSRVAILTEKRSVMPLLIVAIWKCGAVYTPLDGSEPPARLAELLARLAPAAVIALDDREPVGPAGCFLGRAGLAGILAGPATFHQPRPRRPEQAAYIVWASGSTGEPQGVEVADAALLSYFSSHNELLGITAASRVLSLAPFSADVSLEDTLLPLSLGAFVYQFRNLPVGPILRAVLARERITHLIAVSLLLAMITGDGRQLTRAKLPDLGTVMTGAQVCDPAVVRIWREQLPEVRFLHAFGPPEATVFCIGSRIEQPAPERAAGRPLGRPLRGMTVKIVRNGAAVSQPGVEGELWVGGPQVMRGYFDRPEETARLVVELDGTRYFRTGDICSMDGDGTVVFHRHGDPAITWLAGRRTHLDEIRRTALGCPGVEGAVAGMVRRGPRDVLALLVRSPTRSVLAEVADRLRAVLPEYLRPAVWGWSLPEPAGPAADRTLFTQLGAADQLSKSPFLALSADGAIEPIDEVQLCQQQ